MDRLFRSEIEAEEKEREVEAGVDFKDYLQPEPELPPEPEAVEPAPETPAKGGNKGLMIGLAAAAVVVLGIVGWMAMGGKEPAAPLPTPTPSAEEEAAARAAQEERLKELAAQMFEERMQEDALLYMNVAASRLGSRGGLVVVAPGANPTTDAPRPG